MVLVTPNLFRLVRSGISRLGFFSLATIVPLLFMSWAIRVVLLPGAAQRSSTASIGLGPRARTAKIDESACEWRWPRENSKRWPGCVIFSARKTMGKDSSCTKRKPYRSNRKRVAVILAFRVLIRRCTGRGSDSFLQKASKFGTISAYPAKYSSGVGLVMGISEPEIARDHLGL